MAEIWDQHRAAFRGITAYVIVGPRGGKIATIALKTSASGDRVTAYLHVMGVEMVRAYAKGYGFDKHSAAIYSAAERLPDGDRLDPPRPEVTEAVRAIKAAATAYEGSEWERRIREAGFAVFQVI